MGKDEKQFDAGVAFFIFTLAVIIHNSFAPRHFRQELNEYSMKCYVILVLIGLLIAFIKERIELKRRQEAIEAEEKRVKLLREQRKQWERERKEKERNREE